MVNGNNCECDDGNTFTFSCGSTSSSACSSVYSSSCSASCNSCGRCDKCCDDGCVQCEKVDEQLCKRVAQQYEKCKQALTANKETMILLEFLSSKLESVQPLLKARDVTKYSVHHNINFIECFVDALFCVLRTNKALSHIKFTDCKVKNDECNVDDREYLIKVRFTSNTKTCCNPYTLHFNWTSLTGNFLTSYTGILNRVREQIAAYLTELKADSTRPYVNSCCQ
jgi:hypothetical protein